MNISIIDDEKILATKTSKKLEKHGYCVNVFHSCAEFYNAYFSDSDLYIIDLGLGDGSGFDIIEWLRKEKQTQSPIIITSAFADAEKKIYGLEIGADDYMTKPCHPDELIARVKANLRRTGGQINQENTLEYKNISYDQESNVVKVAGEKVNLTKKETQLVYFFLSHVGKLISKNKLIFAVWDSTDFASVSDNTINVTISKIRKKLGDQFTLKTKINEGYILEND